MPAFNKVFLMGNLCRDPNMKATQRGSSIAELSMAISSSWTDKTTNTKKEEVCYVDVTLFGKLADLADQYLAKGSCLLVSGRLVSQSWTDKESGKKRTKLVVVGEEIQFISNSKGSKGESKSQQSDSRGGGQPEGEDFTGEFPDDDVPF